MVLAARKCCSLLHRQLPSQWPWGVAGVCALPGAEERRERKKNAFLRIEPEQIR